MNIIMIGLAKELPEHDETYELHRLLGALLSRELTIDEKLDIIGNEYDIPLDCLLYTSPSPRDAHESRMPSSA